METISTKNETFDAHSNRTVPRACCYEIPQANLVYVDQPINTGFSYSKSSKDTVHSEKVVAEDMLDFLQEFLDAHPDLQGRPFFVTGESYAGHYVPAVSSRIFTAIANGEVSADIINFKGFAIGNGLTDPALQYGAYADFSLAHNLIKNMTANHINEVSVPHCDWMIRKCTGDSLVSKAACIAALTICQETIVAPILSEAGNINVYDVREECKYPPLCYDFSNLDKYINQDSVRKALGVGNRTWESCSQSVYTDMMGDWMRDLEPVIPAMLESGVRALVYAGDEDFICNWLGNQRWTLAMPWSGQKDFNEAAKNEKKFVVDGEEAGSAIEVEGGPLTFLRVFDAGHMVPMNQPRHAQEMLARFVAGKPM